MLSHEVAKATQGEMLPDDTISIKLKGLSRDKVSAHGLPKALRSKSKATANDYVGKGLVGRQDDRLPAKRPTLSAEDNILLGNVILYGATSGEAYFSGIAAERFCVRNSGATAVVEGIGDHGCEYMTGGRVVILGKTGRNFRGRHERRHCLCLDTEGEFHRQCNSETFELKQLSAADKTSVRALIEKHKSYTGLQLRTFTQRLGLSSTQFVKVMPSDYKRVLEAQQRENKDNRRVGLGRLTSWEKQPDLKNYSARRCLIVMLWRVIDFKEIYTEPEDAT